MRPETPREPIARYQAVDFAAPARGNCDLIMKGGITSGVVYPYALLELGKSYRFKSIGGASAGAIAAAFAAAAEYARTVRGDAAGFLRMQARCDELPARLASLFQPAPRFRPLMTYLLRAQARKGAWSWIWNLFAVFWLTTAAGLAAGAGVMALLGADLAGLVLGAAVGLAGALAARILLLLLTDLPRNGFGFCTGMTEPGAETPAVTDWIHASLQDIAFGDPNHARPLTFGDLSGPDPAAPVITLKMLTTNLSMRRPHRLPELGVVARFKVSEWSRLFPAPVIDHMRAVAAKDVQDGAEDLPGSESFPLPSDLPVLVGVRMSLSFPVLFQAVPLYTRDVETASVIQQTGAPSRIEHRRIWFSDGGLSSNFPIHLFDALLPAWPTFALSLDELPQGARKDGKRVFLPETAGQGFMLPVHEVAGLAGFAGSLLGAAKDWRDNMLGAMPGHRERIARVYLSKDEGGLNLTMPEARSRALMTYGLQAGQAFVNTFDFDEHRWRRTLTAFEQLEDTVHATHRLWTQGGYDAWYAAYAPHALSYKKVTKADREKIGARLKAFAGLVEAFTPPVPNKPKKFPRPAGRLRIVPDI
ncbi:MAG: patatin-like phospholipase family protein [Caulobacter sp.]|nr:patatin-like phospholipase family protein [Caulobacter sp.]